MITAEVIKELNSPSLVFVSGNTKSIAALVSPPERATAESLVFASKKEQLEMALAATSPIIVAHSSLALPPEYRGALFQTTSIQLAMADVLPLFDGKMNRFSQETKIHPQSFIHPTAHLGKNVSVGPFAVIGEQAMIGEGTTIGAGTVIESFAKVGAHTLLHPQVFIGSHCEVGSHCELHPHVTIGSDGFSFAPTKSGTLKKIPQIGKVIIGDHVEIGASCAIDRAALTETKIGNGTKFDNLCHIAHNVIIGENCVFAKGLSVAGSTVIGNNLMSGGDVSITDHVTICNQVVLAGRAVVTNDITQPGQYGGYPLEPLRDALKTIANKTQLTRIRKDLARVLKHLNLKEE